jgi:hypothetical protein
MSDLTRPHTAAPRAIGARTAFIATAAEIKASKRIPVLSKCRAKINEYLTKFYCDAMLCKKGCHVTASGGGPSNSIG